MCSPKSLSCRVPISSSEIIAPESICLYLYVCVYVYVYVYVNVYVCICIRVTFHPKECPPQKASVCVGACMYVCMSA
jgi:hypothetical protein